MICLPSATASPTSGSDVAAAPPRPCATATSGSSTARRCSPRWPTRPRYVFLLTRTNPDVPKHKGLTMFLVPMDTPGIEITPVHTLGGERTNITFYNDVRVARPLPGRRGRRRLEGDDGRPRRSSANAAWYGEAVRLLDQAVEWAASTTSADGGRDDRRPARPRAPGRGRRRTTRWPPARLAGGVDRVHGRAARRRGLDGQALHHRALPARRRATCSTCSAPTACAATATPGRAGRRLDRGHLPPLPGHHHLRRHQRGPARASSPSGASASPGQVDHREEGKCKDQCQWVARMRALARSMMPKTMGNSP